MSDNSAIEWTDATWNPTVGCSVLTPGCTNCYAMKLAGRLEAMGQPIYQGHTTKTKAGFVWNGKVSLSNWGQVIKPLSWKKPRRIFVNSMSDLFHEALTDAEIDQVFAVMALCPQHTFQVLTKRAERMRDYLSRAWERREALGDLMTEIGSDDRVGWYAPECDGKRGWAGMCLPLPNVWLGISAEDQQRWDERVPILRDTPAAVRFISAEPLLGPIDGSTSLAPDQLLGRGGIDRVIVGGESGPGARPMHPNWARSLRDQCAAAGVPFFFKQWGEWIDADQRLEGLTKIGFQFHTPGNREPSSPLNFDDAAGLARTGDFRLEHRSDGSTSIRVGKKRAGRLLDGREWNEFPKVAA